MSRTLARQVSQTCHLNGTFLLRSGQTSTEYFDKYLFEGQPRLLREVAQEMVGLLPDCDVLAGMELGGIPLATVMSQLTGLPTVFVRKRAKEYGTRKVAEGGPVAGRRVAVIEDVVTTGGALLASCQALRAEGASVHTVVCAIDREQGGAENLAAQSLLLRAAFTRTDLESSTQDSGRTHYSRLSKIVVDVPEPFHDAAVAFWREALGVALDRYEQFPEYHGSPLAADGFGLLTQHLHDGSPRVHLDIHTSDRAAEVARLLGLGATMVDDGEHWTILRDPAGLVFCVIPDRSIHGGNARGYAPTVVPTL